MKCGQVLAALVLASISGSGVVTPRGEAADGTDLPPRARGAVRLHEARGSLMARTADLGAQTIRTTEALGGCLLGDLDGDGVPTVGDAIKILRIAVGLDPYDSLADLTQDNTVDVGDAIKVLRCAVGLDPWPVPDVLEENDTQETARTLEPGSWSNLTVPLGDEDWYKVSVPPGKQIAVDLTFNHKHGNIDLEIYRSSDGVRCDRSHSSTDDEHADCCNTSCGDMDYYVRVYLNGGTCNMYDMTINTSEGCTCTPQMYWVGLPNTFCPGAALNLFYRAQARHASDNVTFQYKRPGEAEVRSGPVHSYAGGCILQDYSEDTLDTTGFACGPLQIRLYGYLDSADRYTPWETVNCRCDCMTPDALEENDTRETAQTVSAGSWSNLTVQQGDEDWYRVSVPKGCKIEVDLNFTRADGRVWSRIYRGSASNPCSSSTGDTSPSHVECCNMTGGQDYYVRVLLWAYGPSCQSYQMTITTSSVCAAGH